MFTLKHALLATALFAAMGSVHAAELPQSATLKYSGSLGIPATMTFKRTGDNYTVTANINVPMYKISFQSGGKVVGTQLKPSYYRDTRNGKLYASAKFNNGRVTYGRADGKPNTQAVSGSVMDLFTLSWHLAFNNGQLPSNLSITNGKTLNRANGIAPAGSLQSKVGGGTTTINQYKVHNDNGEVTYAFAPALHNVPAIIKYNDGDRNYHLTLKSVTIDGKPVKP